MTSESEAEWPTQNDIGWFEEALLADLDSWFTADIACCDGCHDEFVALWPHANEADDYAFQSGCIPLDVFYGGSRRVQGGYSRAQFDELIKHVRCPRCGSPLSANIWAYNLPFDVEDGIEESIKEVAELAHSTPLLMLKHPFAAKVHETIQRVAGRLLPVDFGDSLYRARKAGPDVREDVICFDLPPRKVVEEGRYNHAGSPVLYLASDAQTCYEEMGCVPCLIAEVKITPPLRLLDLCDPSAPHREDADQLSALTYSALLSAKRSTSGWHKPEYVFSRFVADCARASGIQAIKYPSTKMTGKNFNLVIVDPAFSLAKDASIVGYHRVG